MKLAQVSNVQVYLVFTALYEGYYSCNVASYSVPTPPPPTTEEPAADTVEGEVEGEGEGGEEGEGEEEGDLFEEEEEEEILESEQQEEEEGMWEEKFKTHSDSKPYGMVHCCSLHICVV